VLNANPRAAGARRAGKGGLRCHSTTIPDRGICWKYLPIADLQATR
jgi:hypothetical protein